MTGKTEPDNRELRTEVKEMGVNCIILYVDTVSSFGLKFRIGRIGGNRVYFANSSIRNLHFSYERNIICRRGEVMFHRNQIRVWCHIKIKINAEELDKVLECTRTSLLSCYLEWSPAWAHLWSLPQMVTQ